MARPEIGQGPVPERVRMFKRLAIAVILLAIVAGGLVGFNLFRSKMIADFFANRQVPPATVAVYDVKPVTWSPVIEAIGTANASQGVQLTVETAGVVREILFTANDKVAQGETLLRLDSRVQAADVEAARTQVDLTRQTLARNQQLQRRGVSTNVSLEEAEASARAAEAQLASTVAVLDQRNLDAPFPGTVGIPRVDLGQYVSPGTTVATLQDLETMRVDFSVPEQRLRELSITQQLNVWAGGMTEGLAGQVTGIDPRVDPQSRLVSVRGSVANPGQQLTPGQFVRIAVALPEEKGVIAVPLTAVISSLYGDYVYLVQPKQDNAEQLEVRQSFVTIGRRSGPVAEIVSGVKEGDRVVTAGQNRLSNGQPAEIDNAINPAVQETEAYIRSGGVGRDPVDSDATEAGTQAGQDAPATGSGTNGNGDAGPQGTGPQGTGADRDGTTGGGATGGGTTGQ